MNRIVRYSLSKFKLIVALLSPNSFFAVTLYLPASSTVTSLIWSDAKYDWPSLSTVCWKWSNRKAVGHHRFWPSVAECRVRCGWWIVTLCRFDSFTKLALCDQETDGFGSALILHSNSKRLPSSSCRIDGFLTNVGAIPSICLRQFRRGNKEKERVTSNDSLAETRFQWMHVNV